MKTAIALLALVSVVAPLRADSPAPEPIAPGIWRLRYGHPEPHTPLTYRSAPIRTEGLDALPRTDAPPLDPALISFTARTRGVALELPLSKDERLYGLGLNTKSFELSGRRTLLAPDDNPESDSGTSHAPVPFYVSSRGFGVYVDTARFVSFFAGDVDPTSKPPTTDGANNASSATGAEDLYRARQSRQRTMLVDVPAAQGVDVYLFAGPTMLDAVRRYNLFSGGGCVPPLWGLGIAYRGLNKFSAAESLSLAKSFRDDHIPCDVWGVEPGWQTHAYSCSFVWNKQTFPDPDGFIHQMHALGYHLNFWEHCFTHPSSPIHDAIAPYSGNYRVWSGLVPDFATQQARKIFLDQHEKVLFSKDISGVKLDECDHQPYRAKVWSFPEASSFPSGMDGEQMHSLLGILYMQTMLEPYTHRNLRTWGFVRDSHALAAPLPYVLYSDSYDHRCYVRGVARSGFTGLLWTPEVRNADSVEDFYRRTETVIFTPYAQINCWFLRMPPWVQVDREKNNAGEVMPDAKEVTATVRKLFDLRMSLVPYLYAAFNDYHLRGTPPNRALALDYPDDKTAATVDDEFLCGPSLLVAPMFQGQSARSVYLPKGAWYDFYTGERLEGGRRIDVSKPADTIPVFVKSDTLLPLAKPTQHFTPDTCYDLTIRAYGPHPAPATLYEDDGATTAFAAGQQNRLNLTWHDGKGAVEKTGTYDGPPRYKVIAWQGVE